MILFKLTERPYLPARPLTSEAESISSRPQRWARRRGAIATLALVLALAACTGTVDIRPPSLLVVGFGEAGAGQVALVDVRVLEPGVPPEDRGLIAVRPLPEGGRPVAFDVVDRGGDRTELVVASRTADGRHHLSQFHLIGIDADEPAAFAEIIDRRIDLTQLEQICPKRIAVDSGARYLASLNDEAICPDSPAITVVDIAAPEPSVTATLDVAPTGPVIRDGLYLDQESNLLYYLAERAGDIDVRARDPATDEDVSVARVPFDPGDRPRDLGPVRDSLVVLFEEAFTPIRDFAVAPDVGAAVDTISGSRRLVTDDFRGLPAVLVHSANRLAFHATAAEDDFESYATAGVVDGTLEAVNQFAYLLAPGRIFAFDPLTPGLPPRSASFAAGELEAPAFVTWTLAEFEDDPLLPAP